MKPSEILIKWLRDAYALERGMEVSLTMYMDNDYLPAETRTRAIMHLAETQRRQGVVRRCLALLGADRRHDRTTMAVCIEAIRAFGSDPSHDGCVKETRAAYAAGHFRIASYRALRCAARQLGHPEIAEMCDAILPDEERMTDWLDRTLPEVVSACLQRSNRSALAPAAPTDFGPRRSEQELRPVVPVAPGAGPNDAFLRPYSLTNHT